MPRRAKKMTAALVAYAYIRMSDDEQTLSPDAQRAAIEAFALRLGMTILGWFEDLGLSGGLEIDDRPGLLSCVTAVNAKKNAAMLVAKHDRLARDEFTAASVYRLVERAGGKVLSADGVGNDGSPESHLLRSIVAAFAAYERSMIRVRTKSALKVKSTRGERTGGIPYGFTATQKVMVKDVVVEPARLVPNESEQTVIRRITDMAKSGATFPAIVAVLTGEGIPARGSKWHVTTISRIVRRAEAA